MKTIKTVGAALVVSAAAVGAPVASACCCDPGQHVIFTPDTAPIGRGVWETDQNRDGPVLMLDITGIAETGV